MQKTAPKFQYEFKLDLILGIAWHYKHLQTIQVEKNVLILFYQFIIHMEYQDGNL